MKIIIFINERPMIRKTLEQLNLWNDESKIRPPPVRAGPEHPVQKNQRPAGEQSSRHELFDDGWSGFEEPYITYDSPFHSDTFLRSPIPTISAINNYTIIKNLSAQYLPWFSKKS